MTIIIVVLVVEASVRLAPARRVLKTVPRG